MASNELSIPNPMSANLQPVQDENNVASALSISQNAVQVIPTTTLAPNTFPLAVLPPAAIGSAPCVLLQSLSPEASIRFLASDKNAFHVGIGGGAGAGTFFFFSGSTNKIVVTIGQTGNVTIANNLTVQGSLSVSSIDASKTSLVNMPNATTSANNPLKHVMIDPASGGLFFQ